ncbi:hypothetical protein NW762_011193 [Fusarium torreyae]|uniref:Uncharacterized protein n=1 Tax=Fusarium torreyae TaxID=1237075 RepID=A0A9W8VAQ5_9HYPO|nr:hypothetical protein NW762_011193 [Fusarium torreyae]
MSEHQDTAETGNIADDDRLSLSDHDDMDFIESDGSPGDGRNIQEVAYNPRPYSPPLWHDLPYILFPRQDTTAAQTDPYRITNSLLTDAGSSFDFVPASSNSDRRLSSAQPTSNASGELDQGQTQGTSSQMPDLQTMIEARDQVDSEIRTIEGMIARQVLFESEIQVLERILARMVRVKEDFQRQIDAVQN